MDFKSKNYKDLTRFIYQDLSWGPLFRKKDGEVISSGTYQDLCNPEHPLGISVKV